MAEDRGIVRAGETWRYEDDEGFLHHGQHFIWSGACGFRNVRLMGRLEVDIIHRKLQRDRKKG